MHFVDEVSVKVIAGNGGDGASAWRREKFMPLGGPAGGDGGKGGDVVFEAHERYTTLLDLRYRRVLKAQSGENGRGKDMYGKGGEDLVVQVPPGTQVYDADTGELLADLEQSGTRVVIARGGRGGRGNIHFVTSVNQSPNRAEKGDPGEQRELRLELKLLADVGLLGYPNVGKSTFISAVSRARPKIADYPFTTLVPNLGVVSLGDDRNFVIADIPGIIEGAAQGQGLGLQFLRHVERTRVLLHIITWDPAPERDLVRDFDALMKELAAFDPELSKRPMIVGIGKMDLEETRERAAAARAELEARGIEVFDFSAATHEGMDRVLIRLEQLLLGHPTGSVQAKRFLSARERPSLHGDGKPVPDAESE
ncbi:MAG: GTPase ObgE [Myxococcales bacterium]